MNALLKLFALVAMLVLANATDPTGQPSSQPSAQPSATPSAQPSNQPSASPSGQPNSRPTSQPSAQPSTVPSGQPTYNPTSAPSYQADTSRQVVWDKRRFRMGGLCENQCSGHGTCEYNYNCKCYTGLDGEAEWTGPDCSQRTCPKDYAWVGDVVNANDAHPWAECSNKGICDRSTGTCNCFAGYEGVACQRTVCPNNCNDRGTCWPEKILASKAHRTYSAPWDAMKEVGCFCDKGYRGPACDLQECPTGTDPLDGLVMKPVEIARVAVFAIIMMVLAHASLDFMVPSANTKLRYSKNSRFAV
eukprot:CAMPEP_0202962216 /NCGR_PEP_ID=MMETSP1396-20130829/6314_1 /ASSEMBLY_ACC=CAM_ASM_000872 /TAXON_ID= /ORGANISM="Pseudokeronopsis sp., Strain Brazil" /LENGTH=302 /DNA_ID=CAMNT_0049682635 /DNA_START=59 /DNA_END=968 /DNA_ORIENTATION=+